MKSVKINVDELVYEFYQKIARQAGVPVEEIMSNALYTLAGELSMRLAKGEMRWGPADARTQGQSPAPRSLDWSEVRASAGPRREQKKKERKTP